MKLNLSRNVLNDTVKITKMALYICLVFYFLNVYSVEFSITGGAILCFVKKIQHFPRITLSHAFN